MHAHRLAAAALGLLAFASPAFADETLLFEGDAPDDGVDFFVLPFEVPEGTAEIEVRHDNLSPANVLDWGLDDPDGFRGWGGGNPEPAVVGAQAASRSYLAGPLPAGEWRVVVGKPKIAQRPAPYRVEVHLRDQATLPPEPQRGAWQDPGALAEGPRWYAGDFHVHSRESGDAYPTLDEVAGFARSRGLDFVMLSEHNTVSPLQLLSDVQSRHPELLLVPGLEVTTYAGHANAIGATEWIDHRLGFEGADTARLSAQAAAQDAPLSLSHPTMDLGDMCLGCLWSQDIPEPLAAIEIGSGGYHPIGFLFFEPAVALWERLLDEGRHLAALGGSDDHRAGQDLGVQQSPIGSPTTLVYAQALSVEAIKQAVREGRTVVKLQGPDDPMVHLTGWRGDAWYAVGDTLPGQTPILKVRVEGAEGQELVLVHNGTRGESVPIDADPFDYERQIQAPAEGEDRWRAEVRVDGQPRTVTSHLYVVQGEPEVWPSEGDDEGGCGCTGAAGGADVALALALTGLALSRRRAGAHTRPARR